MANSTAYFSAPAPDLDPRLFEGRSLRSPIRHGVLSLLNDFLGHTYRHPDLWAHAWLAGSAVSFQWSAERSPSDLDCLFAVNFVQFRKANPEYRGLTDKEIADQLNEDLHTGLHPQTENWNGFELTFYAITASDITAIKPYAAYDLKFNEWSVTPNPALVAPSNPTWDSVANEDYAMAHQAYMRATKAYQDLQLMHSGPQHRNQEVALQAAAQQAEALYGLIHGGRSEAFSTSGEGYADFHNYRWQAGKRSGAVNLLKDVRKVAAQHFGRTSEVALPDASTLLRKAALHGLR